MDVDEPVAVEAHFSVEGEIAPRRFTWRGSVLRVEGVGRSWQQGDERCFVVLAAGGRLFELRLDRDALRWRISRVPASKLAA